MRRIWIFGVALALAAPFAAPLRAQDPGEGSQTRERVRRDVERKERLMREGKVVRSNVKITVRLENGARLKGVVRNGRFVERHDGLQFVPSDVASTGSGIRLWYHDQTDGYIFLPFHQIKKHTIGKVLTDEEVREIGLEMKRERARRGKKGKGGDEAGKGGKPGEKGAGEEPGTTPPGDGDDDDEAAQGPQLTAEQEALLREFPPEAGWGLQKLQELERNKIVIDRYPNAKEQKFIDNFGAWKEAHRIWEQIQEEKRRRAEQRQKQGSGQGPRPLPGVGGGTGKQGGPGSQQDPGAQGTPPGGQTPPPQSRSGRGRR